jgi:hypothetical protein
MYKPAGMIIYSSTPKMRNIANMFKINLNFLAAFFPANLIKRYPTIIDSDKYLIAFRINWVYIEIANHE